MPHRLIEHNPLNAIGDMPLILTLRYRCSCAANEVLTINAVVDPEQTTEDAFAWTCRMLWRDMRTEIAQHLGEAKKGEAT